MSAADGLMLDVLCASVGSVTSVMTWEMQDFWGVWGVCLKGGGGG